MMGGRGREVGGGEGASEERDKANKFRATPESLCCVRCLC
jgi:hypothetical protein